LFRRCLEQFKLRRAEPVARGPDLPGFEESGLLKLAAYPRNNAVTDEALADAVGLADGGPYELPIVRLRERPP
jgi:hypothetical protein